MQTKAIMIAGIILAIIATTSLVTTFVRADSGMVDYFKQRLIEARDSGNTDAIFQLKANNGSDSDFIQATQELGGWSSIVSMSIENKGSIGADNTFSETIDKLAEAMK